MVTQQKITGKPRPSTLVKAPAAPRASTRAVHGGTIRRKDRHSLTTPIYQTATFTFADTSHLLDFISGRDTDRQEYGRYGNPTINAVESKIAVLDGDHLGAAGEPFHRQPHHHDR